MGLIHCIMKVKISNFDERTRRSLGAVVGKTVEPPIQLTGSLNFSSFLSPYVLLSVIP